MSEPANERAARPRARRRRWLAFAAIALVALIAFVLGRAYLEARGLWSRVAVIDTLGALSAPEAEFRNLLVVGVDSSVAIDPDAPDAFELRRKGRGRRADTLVLLHLGPDGNRMCSIPRDLWVEVYESGPGKINAATTRGGPAALIRVVREVLELPVHHYLEVDYPGFLAVMQAVGPITIDFRAPACDPRSDLDIRRTGPVELTPEEALAYVRSRTYTEFDAAAAEGLDCKQIIARKLGKLVGNADYGRTERQRRFLLAVFREIGEDRSPFKVLRTLELLGEGLRADDEMSMFDALALFLEFRDFDVELMSLPVRGFRTPKRTSAVRLTEASQPVLDRFR